VYPYVTTMSLFNPKKNIFSFDSIYLTYDEPSKNQRYLEVKKSLPRLMNIDGVKGFDRAHKACAKLAQTDYVTIIDGDNTLVSKPKSVNVSSNLFHHKYVLSFSSINSINGLVYGNGGVKCWPKSTLLSMNSHESAKSKKAATDFCYTVPYYQIPMTPTQTNIHLTPYQAFRSGFREGIKMSLIGGLPPQHFSKLFHKYNRHNLYRLKVWSEVGRDVKNGIWSIYGARLGCFTLLTNIEKYQQIQNYTYFEKLWKENISLNDPEKEANILANQLKRNFSLSFGELKENQSKLFKSVIENPRREGPMTL